MKKERELYNKFVEVLTEKLGQSNISAKELDVILDFLKYNNIQATQDNERVSKLMEKYLELPFDGEELLPLEE